MKQNKSIEDELYVIGLIALLVCMIGIPVFLYYNSRLPGIPCLLLKLFGIYCPGCGGTRALIHLLHGRVLQSLWYHPLVIYGVVVYTAFMGSHTLRKLHLIKKGIKFREWYLYGALLILLGNFVLKNILKFCFGIVL